MRYVLILLLSIFSLGVLGRIIVSLVVPGARVTSWWRSYEKNVEVGGVKNSRHLIGLAYDVVPATAENTRRLEMIFPRVLDEKTHIHASWF